MVAVKRIGKYYIKPVSNDTVEIQGPEGIQHVKKQDIELILQYMSPLNVNTGMTIFGKEVVIKGKLLEIITIGCMEVSRYDLSDCLELMEKYKQEFKIGDFVKVVSSCIEKINGKYAKIINLHNKTADIEFNEYFETLANAKNNNTIAAKGHGLLIHIDCLELSK